MSFTLPSTTATSLSAPSTTQATARQDEQEQNKPGSFGEALSRSMAPARDATEKTGAKTATPSPARRPSDSKKTDADDLVNAMALALPALETRMVNVAPPGSGGTVGGSTPPAAAAASLPDLLANTAVPAEVSALSFEAGIGSDAGTGTSAGIALQPLLASVGQKDTGHTVLQPRLTPVSEGPAIQVDLGKIAGQPATAANTDTPDQSAKRDDGKTQQLDEPTEAGTALTPVTAQHAAKVAPTHTAPPLVEATVSAPAGSPAPVEATLNASTVLPVHPANLGVQGPGAVSTLNAPPPVTTASLTPEVGSSEWGKALGQQVIQMGTAGHQVAELQLNPPGLGPLKVTLSMNEHQVQAMFVSAHSSVRAAVEAALPQLRTTLADSGISLGNTSVSSESQQQAAFAGNPDKQPGTRTYRGESAVDTAALPARALAESPRRSSGIGVDTYA